MNHEEYLALYRTEKDHWFYTGKREIVLRWIARLNNKLTSVDTVLDAGAGTGQMVLDLRASPVTREARILGIEYEEEPRRIARELNGLELKPGSILELPLLNDVATVSIALDVLEHVENDRQALDELIRVTKPGGHVLINVPAFPALWSAWDVSLGHFRRYTLRTLRAVLRENPHHEIVYLAYNNNVIFPLVWLYRKFAPLLPRVGRMEDSTPPLAINRLLRRLYVIPASLEWMRIPFGVSLFAVLRKKQK